MFRAVTLSRSPPRADTTMIATGDRSRICRHSSNPSANGSIRSSSTMSGCSVSSRVSTLLPSVDSTVSKPRTARFERIRSTMLGSSSTTSTLVDAAWLLIVASLLRRLLHGQGNPQAGPARRLLQLQEAAVRLHDALGDGQAEAGAGVPAPVRPAGPRGRRRRGRAVRGPAPPALGSPDNGRAVPR